MTELNIEEIKILAKGAKELGTETAMLEIVLPWAEAASIHIDCLNERIAKYEELISHLLANLQDQNVAPSKEVKALLKEFWEHAKIDA